ncbi:CHAT domain-containing protein [Nostoc sp. C117]|uniref:nSTAND1 domain-containing NTPase n=1 Tax=Nostoc sp. C117 TaxID=3349875 RepID=UPI00370D1F51
MNTFEITIQRKSGDNWPIVVEHTQPGILLPLRSEGNLCLTDEDFQRLTSLLGRVADYGTFLGKALLRDEVRDGFVRALSHNQQTLRVLLFIEAADKELRTLRWERLCAPIDGDWQMLAINQRVPFCFYIPAITDRLFPPIGRRDLRALVLVASPSDSQRYKLDTFDVEATVKSVQSALGDIPTDVLATVDGAIGLPTLDELCTHLTDRTKQYTILHFVSHGRVMDDGETLLYWSKPDNTVEVVTATRLLERVRPLRGARGLPHFTFLCTCESASPSAEAGLGGLGQRLVRDLGMPAVVAMTEKVTIKTAQALAEKFYFQLRESGEVDSALHEATAGLAERGDVTVPALFSRLGGRPLFSDQLDRELTNAEIQYGLEKILELLPERSPILGKKFTDIAQQLKNTLGADVAALSKEALKEREQTLEEINNLSEEILDLTFHALALGQQPPTYDSRCPFRGLYPFRVENREFFFGREQLITQLQQKLTEDNFLAVLGASGSGKSSVVLGGLIPLLQEKQSDLQLAYMTPSSNPIEQLQTSLSPVQGQSSILVIDQFEELFTLCTDEAQRITFIEKLLSLIPHQKVLITMRADFWGECATYRNLKDLMEARQKLIGPMDAAELRKAMEMQAAQVGLRFEPGLSNSILDDVQGEPGAMPLLQHALLEMWKRRHGRWLRGVEYEAIGGVNMAIAQTADDVYNSLSVPEQDQVKNIFIRLTRLDESAMEGEKRRDTRRRVWLDELVAAGGDLASTKQLVQKLAGEGARLVVTSVDSSTNREEVEVAHEALIRYWPRLLKWLDDNRINLQLRETIRQAALEWEKLQKDDNYLVHRGGRLEDAQLLAKHTNFLNQSEADYVNACRELRQREEKEKEARRRREIRTAWGVAGGAVLALIVSTAFGRMALSQKRDAQITKAEALGQYSLSLFASHQYFDALIEGIRAGKILNEYQVTQTQVLGALQKAVYRVREYNRLDIGDKLIFFSPDGKTLASVSYDGIIKLWDLTGKELHTLKHDEVNTLVFSPDGKTLASVSYDGIIKLWDLTGKELYTLKHDEVNDLVFSSEGKTFASTSSDGKVKVWDLTGKQLLFLDHQAEFINSIAFSPDGKTFASGSREGKVKVWDLTGQLLLSFDHKSNVEKANVEKVVFSPDGKTLASIGNRDSTLKLWNLKTKEVFTLQNQDKIENLNFSPDSKTLAYTNSDNEVKLWDLKTKELDTFDHNKVQIESVIFSADSKTVVSGSRDGKIKLWDLKGKELFTFYNQDLVSKLVFTSDGKTLASASDNGIIKLWDLTGKKLPTLHHQVEVESIVFRPNSKTLASVGRDKTLKLWDSEGKELPTLPHHAEVESVVFSPDGKILASVGSDKTLKLWDLKGKELPTLLHHAEVENVVFSPDSKILASVGIDKTLKLWNLTSQTLQIIPDETKVNSVVFSPDGKILVSANQDGIKFLDLTSKELRIFKDRAAVNSVVFSPDGKTLASASEDQTVTLWNLTGKELHTFKKAGVNSLVFSPDGQTFALVSEDQTVKLWNLESNKLQTLYHQVDVNSVVFSPDSKTLISATNNYAVNVWDLTGKLLYTLYDKPERENEVRYRDGKPTSYEPVGKTLVFSPDGKTLAAAGDDKTIILWDWQLDSLMVNACDWASYYLKNRQDIPESDSDKNMCVGIDHSNSK